MKECDCYLQLPYGCDLDNPRCADFHSATYAELEWGEWELEASMLADLEMWRQVRAAENEPPLDAGDAEVMA
jgi:hypothetical protein